MKRTLAIVAVLVMAVLSVSMVSTEDSDGDVSVTNGSTWYCYGDNPTFIFPEYTEGVDVRWEVVDSNGDDVVYTNPDGDPSRINVNLSDCDSVTVTQTVSTTGNDPQSMTITVIPLHLPANTAFPVVFHDGANVVNTQVITNNTVVNAEAPHAIAPMIEKDGYTLDGWFDESGENEADFFEPILEETHFYAKWRYTGVSGGSSDTIVVSDTHTVTFNTSVGLECTPSEPGSNSLMFTVSVIGGYELIGAVSVTSTGGTITQVADGQYLLSGIDSNIIVNITGETVYIEDPDDDITDDNPEEPSINNGNDYTLYAILLIILAVICIALAVYIMKTRGSRV